MYVAGTVLVVCERFGLFDSTDNRKQQRSASGVLVDNYKTTLPMKKGLSSSAAVCVLAVRALSLVLDLQLSVPQAGALLNVCGLRVICIVCWQT